jgi:colanic acid biosynthesis glycosyl transferase WcaI
MRILLHDYAGHAFPVSLSRALAKRGHTVCHAFASALQTPRGALARREGDPEGLSFAALPMSPAYVRDKYSFRKRRDHERAYGRAVARHIAEWRPEVVLSGNTPTETQEYLVRACGEAGAAFCYWVQDFYSLAVTKLVRKKLPVVGELVGAYYRALDRRHLRRSAAVVSITEDFEPQLARWRIPANRRHVVPNWAELEAFPLRPKDNPWAHEHGLTDRFVFLYSGTLGMKHNPALLAALARQFANDPAVAVVVNSEGLGADFLRAEQAKGGLDNLQVHPFQPFERLSEVLGAADVLVTILEPEAGVFSVPSKTLSYLCGGKAILGAMPRENLASRIVMEHAAGRVVEPDDLEGFLAAAATLRADATTREAMGRAARAYAETTFALETITDRFEAIFANVS